MRDQFLLFARLKISLAALLLGVICLAVSPARALDCTSTTCTLSSGATIGFQPVITITKNSDIDFGTVRTGSCTYTINTSGTVSGSPSANCGAAAGSPNAASLTIRGSSTMQVSISAGSYTADRTVTPSAAVGKYDNGSEQALPLSNVAAPTSGGKTLLLGVTISTTGAETNVGSYAPTFTITVIYP